MFIDDVCVLYVTFETLLKDNRDALILMDNICNVFERFGTVDKKFLDNFVRTHYDVFEVIFNEAILDEDVDDEINGEDIEEDEEVGAQSERIDDTTNLTRTILRNTRAILKRMAKERADYKCELSIIRSCSYFTSREDNHNYLEIHHLIPFAFSNEFENTLETIDNYVALCPNCHRLLHHGSDRERKAALTYLYNIRKDKLKEAGLEITLEQLFDFYQVTDN